MTHVRNMMELNSRYKSNVRVIRKCMFDPINSVSTLRRSCRARVDTTYEGCVLVACRCVGMIHVVSRLHLRAKIHYVDQGAAVRLHFRDKTARMGFTAKNKLAAHHDASH